MATETLIKALAVVCELTGTELSKAALSVMAMDLSEYPERQVLGALQRCRQELRGRLTLADVISRLDDGRPGPEEAWAMAPRGEGDTVVWTQEMAQAHAAAAPLLEQGDKVAARMTFLECYRKLVADARAARQVPIWEISLGWDVRGRAGPLLRAVAKGVLTQAEVMPLLPTPEAELGATKVLAAPKAASEIAMQTLTEIKLTLNPRRVGAETIPAVLEDQHHEGDRA